MEKIIKVNVGGKIFETSKDTLCKSTYFSSLFSRWSSISQQNEIFIDRDPIAFEHILNLLRDSNYPFPKKYLYELDFYGVVYTDSFEKELVENRKELSLALLDKSNLPDHDTNPYTQGIMILAGSDEEDCLDLLGLEKYIDTRSFTSLVKARYKGFNKNIYSFSINRTSDYINNPKLCFYVSSNESIKSIKSITFSSNEVEIYKMDNKLISLYNIILNDNLAILNLPFFHVINKVKKFPLTCIPFSYLNIDVEFDPTFTIVDPQIYYNATILGITEHARISTIDNIKMSIDIPKCIFSNPIKNILIPTNSKKYNLIKCTEYFKTKPWQELCFWVSKDEQVYPIYRLIIKLNGIVAVDIYTDLLLNKMITEWKIKTKPGYYNYKFLPNIINVHRYDFISVELLVDQNIPTDAIVNIVNYDTDFYKIKDGSIWPLYNLNDENDDIVPEKEMVIPTNQVIPDFILNSTTFNDREINETRSGIIDERHDML